MSLPTVKTATFIGPVNPEARGEQRLYRLSTPLEGYSYVVVSGVGPDSTPLGPDAQAIGALAGMAGALLGSDMDYSNMSNETFIFGADETGVVAKWNELPGSFRGDKDFERALRGAGYEVVDPLDKIWDAPDV